MGDSGKKEWLERQGAIVGGFSGPLLRNYRGFAVWSVGLDGGHAKPRSSSWRSHVPLSAFSIFEIDAIPWQNPSRPIPNFLLANPIEKIRKIAPYHCKNQPLPFEAGYVNIHRFLDVSSLTKTWQLYNYRNIMIKKLLRTSMSPSITRTSLMTRYNYQRCTMQ